ncbi:Cobalt-zinc-cadmium resistance protein CzcA, Cation efflux system protein CusA [Methylophaga frappieri]|uniref:Cobalt-zinc-cadmium resistance protein CzcA, Cation efflux system protein CusA n=1 Tax=Methylophaga frappieri (strain ATCC BAA-2434 / DSM 25690 / JAM7) TaxID=754477 RepID=I1YL92_METFJ|nr:CusA/CzcA family heavy metal efflux RND transporter [Methylophaga frappieri]AFJ03685.1 Cobalt-zinc-cadmium resistance protein CzcA, Cation efflux system protein CusA [Methylophaga frappieri]
MVNLIVKFAIQQRWLVLLMTLFIGGLGGYNMLQLPVDAVPDITNNQVQINTELPGFSPLEAEQRVTYLVENAMAGLPNLDYTRSISRYGLSQVTVVFDESVDIYLGRQQISERLQAIRGDLPVGAEPQMGPVASGLGEIFTYAVRAKTGALRADGQSYTPEDLRTIQDWIIRPQLVKVPGVTEINSVGGYERIYQVAPKPDHLLAYKISMAELSAALQNNNQNVGAGYIERYGEQWLVRSPGQLQSLADIRNVVIRKLDDTPVRVSDVADVSLGKQLRTGAATLDGQETVLGTAMMLLGENSRIVARAVAEKLVQVNQSLPEGIVAEAVYDRTTLVDKTIQTVQKNLLEGALLVIVVLFLLLGNIRAALITALVIPLSMLFAVTGMVSNKISGNLMSLGAIDFGLIVDGAVIVVENALSRLSLAQQRFGRLLTLSERLQTVSESTREVFNPAVFGMLIIMLVYLPLFALSGVEGKMFQPMAFTVIAALTGALIFAVTFVPAAIAVFVTGRVSEKENFLMRFARRIYQPFLTIALKLPFVVTVTALIFVIFVSSLIPRLGSEFLPQLDEGDVALHALRITGTGLEQSVKMQKQLDRVIRDFDEVERVFSKIGTPDIATDPMPPSVADTFVIVKPQSEWPDPQQSKATFLSKLREAVEAVPGNKYEFTQPIEMRFNELIAGVRADVAIRIYGDDLDILAELGEQTSSVIQLIEGARDVRMEQVTGLSMLSINPQRDHLALLGLNISALQDALQMAMGGQELGLIYEGDKRFKLVMRFDETKRQNVAYLEKLPVALPENGDPDLSYVPLGEVADIEEVSAPSQINRESGKRNVIVSANVSDDRDLGSFIAEVQQKLPDQVNYPAGYWVEYGGSFEQLQSAQKRLLIVVPVTLFVILVLLFMAFKSLRDTLLVFTGVPLALTGGVLALFWREMPLSVSAAVGFIALSGIAVLNGIVMLIFIRQLWAQGKSLRTAVFEGAMQRLRPVLMTALVASLGFLPMALNTGTGAEVQRPLATVVVGGILSSTILTLLVLPALYFLMHRFSKQHAH